MSDTNTRYESNKGHQHRGDSPGFYKEALSVLMLCASSNHWQPFFHIIQKWWPLSIFMFCPFSHEINWHKLRKVYST